MVRSATNSNLDRAISWPSNIGVPVALPTQIWILQLKTHGIHKLIVIGLRANTYVESTVRFAAELGYEVTMVKDATADYSDEEMHAALDVNIPNYASAIVTANEVVDAISSLQILGIGVKNVSVNSHQLTNGSAELSLRSPASSVQS